MSVPRFALDAARKALQAYHDALDAFEADDSQANANAVGRTANAFHEIVGAWPIGPGDLASPAFEDVPF